MARNVRAQRTIEQQQPRAMDYERANGSRNRPDCELHRLHQNSVLLEEALDEEYRADRDEDVFAEEEGNVVDGGSVCPDLVAHRLWKLAVLVFRRTLRHWCDQRAYHLCVTAQRSKAEGGGDLADGEVD